MDTAKAAKGLIGGQMEGYHELVQQCSDKMKEIEKLAA
jgi:hypothetical protein